MANTCTESKNKKTRVQELINTTNTVYSKSINLKDCMLRNK